MLPMVAMMFFLLFCTAPSPSWRGRVVEEMPTIALPRQQLGGGNFTWKLRQSTSGQLLETFKWTLKSLKCSNLLRGSPFSKWGKIFSGTSVQHCIISFERPLLQIAFANWYLWQSPSRFGRDPICSICSCRSNYILCNWIVMILHSNRNVVYWSSFNDLARILRLLLPRLLWVYTSSEDPSRAQQPRFGETNVKF